MTYWHLIHLVSQFLFMAVISANPLFSALPNGKTNTSHESFIPDASSLTHQKTFESRSSVKKKWEKRDIFHAGTVGSVHLLCLFAPWTFSWSALGVGYFLYILTGVFGVTLSYHRNLAHKSFRLPKYLEYLFAYFAVLALQGDPIFWVSTHRHHHKVTDTIQDPHSPIEGFWFSHILWLFDANKAFHKGVSTKNVGDLKRQPYYRFLKKTMFIHVYLLVALLYMLGGFPFIVWGMGVRTVWGYHITFAVNSACHIWGFQSWKTGDLSKNNWIVAILAFGEGWHNNHHAFDYSARHGLEWWQLDMTWYFIKLLEYVGLATDVKVPSEQHKKRMASGNGVEGKKHASYDQVT